MVKRGEKSGVRKGQYPLFSVEIKRVAKGGGLG